MNELRLEINKLKYRERCPRCGEKLNLAGSMIVEFSTENNEVVEQAPCPSCGRELKIGIKTFFEIKSSNIRPGYRAEKLIDEEEQEQPAEEVPGGNPQWNDTAHMTAQQIWDSTAPPQHHAQNGIGGMIDTFFTTGTTTPTG